MKTSNQECGEECIICPFCGDRENSMRIWVHIQAVEIDRLGKVMLIAGCDNPVETVKEEPDERGSSVTTYFFCEAGHHWKEIRHFHEGNVSEEIIRLPDLSQENGIFGWLDELPRD